MRKKKKSYACNNQVNYGNKKEETCVVNDCSCKVKNCIPDKNIQQIDSCKPTNCKPKIKEYPCACEECEIKYEDKCEDLAKKAQELFEKALKYENKALETFKEAKDYEENAICLSQKSSKLMQNAKEADKASKNASCKAQELIKSSEELCNKAKCLYKEANTLDKEAKESCENAKCAYEKAENYNEQAKYLYNQALKYDQKVLKCYKNAGEKIKEYEIKAQKCEELINKCNTKLNNYNEGCISNKKYLEKEDVCGCNEEFVVNEQDYCDCVEKTYYDSCDNGCKYSYINPIYDMTPMHYMGDMSYQYIDFEAPYIAPEEIVENVNDIWSNYYMYMQKIMNSME